MNISPTTRNVMKAYRAASLSDMAEGMTWYRRAQHLAAELEPDNIPRAAAVIATLSPLKSWSINVSLARRAYALPRDDVAVFVDGMPTMKLQAIKTYHILESTSDDELDSWVTGPKVRPFWQSILDPDSGAVTIDRHAVDVALGRVTDDHTRELLLKRVGVRETFIECYRRAAKRAGIHPAQMQAITWVYWRRNHAHHKRAHQKGLWG